VGVYRPSDGPCRFFKSTIYRYFHLKISAIPIMSAIYCLPIFTARCYAECGNASVYRRSVLPSVTFRYRDHIGWNTLKIISRPNQRMWSRNLNVTDRKTDERTDGRHAISSRGKNCGLCTRTCNDAYIENSKNHKKVIRPNPKRTLAGKIVLRSPPEQESLAIAKTTARCAQYMGALKSFESPRKRPRLLFLQFVKGFCSDRY